MIWSKHDIRNARKIPLLPVLTELGYSLRKLEYGNYLVEKHGSVIIKDNYWFWKENHSAGNAIDFFVIVEKRFFTDSVVLLSNLRQQCSHVTKTLQYQFGHDLLPEKSQGQIPYYMPQTKSGCRITPDYV